MSQIQKNKLGIKSKVAASAVLVALSGFVPAPIINTAHAAVATINVSGSFITGIQLTAGVNMDLARVAVVTAAGKMTLSTAGVLTPTGGKAVVSGAVKAGTFVFKAVSTAPNVDITIKCTEANGLVFAATTGGKVASGTAKLAKVIVGGIGPAVTIDITTTVTTVNTSGKKAGFNITAGSTGPGVLKLGSIVTWGAAIPYGAYVAPIIVTVAY